MTGVKNSVRIQDTVMVQCGLQRKKKKLNCIFRIIIIDPILKILSLPQLIDETTEAQRD